ncbi:MAG: tetratricopeptide repeat protein [Planctomyces sp.]|nr:tetratricopeptide repeat protein [Planctomyces sp.]
MFVLKTSFALIVAAIMAASMNVCFAQAPATAPKKDPRIGTRVLVTRAGAELRTPQSTVWKAYLGEVYTVALTNGEWLWIDERGGWLWEKETIPYETAPDELSRRVTTKPTAENYHLRGVAFLAHKQFDRAIADFTESLRRENRNPGAFNNRGQCHYLQGNYAMAIEDFSTALKQDPKNFLARNNRALAYIASEDWNSALSDLQAAIAQVPEYPEALNNRGVVLQKQGKLDESIRDFSAALRIDPRYTDALGNRAYTYRLKGEYGSAITDLEQAIRIRPQTYEAINDLAWILATAPVDKVRNPAKALELAKQACAISDFKQWNTLDTLAAAHAENGQFEDAKQWIGAAIELAPEKEKARLQTHFDAIHAGNTIRE